MDSSKRQFDFDTIVKQVEELRNAGKKIVYCHGCFDLMHPGHIKHLQSASKMGDVLVVTVSPDRFVDKGPGRPVFNETLRAQSIAALSCVDFAGINQWPTAEPSLLRLRPHIYVKGQEFENKIDPTGKIEKELEVVSQIGAKMRYTHDIVFSSSSLLNAHFSQYSDELLAFIDRLKQQKLDHLVWQILDRMQALRILVIGDPVAHEYLYCKSEEPCHNGLPQHRVTDRIKRYEGSVELARYTAGVSNHVTLILPWGKGHFPGCHEGLDALGNVDVIWAEKTSDSTLWMRTYADQLSGNTLFTSKMGDRSDIEKYQERVSDYILAHNDRFDLILVNDSGLGYVSSPMIQAVCKKNVPFAASISESARLIGLDKYEKGGHLVFRESSPMNQDTTTGIGKRLQKWSNCLKTDSVGQICSDGSASHWLNGCFVHMPAVLNPADRFDSFNHACFALNALAACMAAPLEISLFLGTMAGGMICDETDELPIIDKQKLSRNIRAILK